MSTLEIEKIAKQIVFNEEKLRDNELYKILIGEVDKYVGKAVSISVTTRENFSKIIENKTKMDGRWVFDCFDKIFSHDVCKSWKPVYVVSHYRGLRFTDAKETSKFTPSDQDNMYITILILITMKRFRVMEDIH